MEAKPVTLETAVFPVRENLIDLIKHDGIAIHCHTVSSVRRACVVGVEALSRGKAKDGALIPPMALFAEAQRLGLTCELDRACQRAAFSTFAPLHAADPNLLLFVNLHAECIADALSDNGGIVALAHEFGIAPRCVVVEILETAIEDSKWMRDAIALYKQNGFLVALDDVGAGHSSLNRILFVRPDILKADRSLIENIENDFYKQEIYKAVLQMGEKLGGWVVTEGVEKQNEALVALGLGADLFQGFYFDKPHWLDGHDEEAARNTTRDLQQNVERVRDTALCFKQQTLQKIHDEREARRERRNLSLTVVKQIQAWLDETTEPRNVEESAAFLETLLRNAIAPHPAIESASLVDSSGKQITETVLHPYPQEDRKAVFYPPPAKGTSHALKEYFYVVQETPIERYETMPYVPLPSGDMCITISARAHWRTEPLVVCLHLFVAHAVPLPPNPARMD